MKEFRSVFVGVLLLATMAAGCGSCQKDEAPPPASGAPAQGAAVSAPTAAKAAAGLPTARSLPTMAESAEKAGSKPGPAPGLAANKPGAPAAHGEEPQEGEAAEEPEDEADCSVVADADPDFGKPPLSVQFSVEFECTDGSTPTVSWDFGDGSSGTGEVSPSHTYASAGEFVARVTITTPDGKNTSDEIDISTEDDALDDGD